MNNGTGALRQVFKYIVMVAIYEAVFLSIYNAIKVQLLARAAGTVLGVDPGFWLIFLGTLIPSVIMTALALTFILSIFTIVGGAFAGFFGVKNVSKVAKYTIPLAIILVPCGLAVEVALAQMVNAPTAELVVYFASGFLGGVPFAAFALTFIGSIFATVLGIFSDATSTK